MDRSRNPKLHHKKEKMKFNLTTLNLKEGEKKL